MHRQQPAKNNGFSAPDGIRHNPLICPSAKRHSLPWVSPNRPVACASAMSSRARRAISRPPWARRKASRSSATWGSTSEGDAALRWPRFCRSGENGAAASRARPRR